MRLIDADDLAAKIMIDAPDFMDGGSSITKAFILAMVKTRNATPTIDAVPVVRCKDCAHYRYYGLSEETVSECTIDHCENPDENWFCADGCREEN